MFIQHTTFSRKLKEKKESIYWNHIGQKIIYKKENNKKIIKKNIN